jgi:Ca2+/Na+ antiporter
VFLVGSVLIIFLVFCVVFLVWSVLIIFLVFRVVFLVGSVLIIFLVFCVVFLVKHNTENKKDDQHRPHQKHKTEN